MKRAKISSMKLNEKTKLTVKNVALSVMSIMKEHIGRNNAVSKRVLFRKVYAKTYDTDDTFDFLRWDTLRRALHLLRASSNCFVIGTNDRGDWEYFVISTQSDAQLYITQLDNAIVRMKKMQARALRSIEKGWYKQPWQFTSKKTEV